VPARRYRHSLDELQGRKAEKSQNNRSLFEESYPFRALFGGFLYYGLPQSICSKYRAISEGRFQQIPELYVDIRRYLSILLATGMETDWVDYKSWVIQEPRNTGLLKSMRLVGF